MSLSLNYYLLSMLHQNRLPITISSNQSRQVLQHQQLTTILSDKNTTIEQATDRLGITIALFYLHLLGILAQLESILINNQTKQPIK